MDKLFEIYLQELVEWNKKFNLTAITKPEEIQLKHFADSLAILPYLPQGPFSLIDMGTGAGFPGIPIKLARPETKLTLLEATRKKTEFLRHLVKLFNLKDVEIIWGRAEEVAKKKREQFDIAVARAVSKLNALVEYCLPFVKIGGQFIAYKEEKVEAEVAAAQKAIEKAGGRLIGIRKVILPNSDLVRSLVIIGKIALTPAKYPRPFGVAKQKPL